MGLVSAQNQAAISGASMLTILDDLRYQAQRLDSELPTTPTTTSAPPISTFCFSIVTEGPIHELWVHFKHESTFQMECLKVWRVTQNRDAHEFVHSVAQIMRWGTDQFHQSIIEQLDKL
jgi:hypothetical protein